MAGQCTRIKLPHIQDGCTRHHRVAAVRRERSGAARIRHLPLGTVRIVGKNGSILPALPRPSQRRDDLSREPFMMELHVCSRDGALLRAFALGEEAEVIVGRDDSCDIRIGSPSVSREHCAIEREGQELVLRDLGSSGGTFLDGKKIEKVRLRDGMEITVGPALLRFFEAGI